MAGSVDREGAARILQCSTRSTFFYEKKGMPRQDDGTFDPDVILSWFQEFKETGGKASSLVEADTRLRMAQAGLQELKLAHARGEYFPAAVVRSAWERATMSSRSRFLTLPVKLAPQIVSCNSIAEVKDALEKAIHECLDELAVADYSGIVEGPGSGSDGSNGAVEGSPKTDRKRMGRLLSKAKPRGQRRAGAVVHKQS